MATVASVAGADPVTMAAIRRIGPAKAESIKMEAQRLVATTEPGPNSEPGTPATDREQRAKELQKQAKQLRKQARRQSKKAKSAKSKKQRKRLSNEAAKLKKAAGKARRKAQKLLAG